jgi:hypothetical protein
MHSGKNNTDSNNVIEYEWDKMTRVIIEIAGWITVVLGLVLAFTAV